MLFLHNQTLTAALPHREIDFISDLSDQKIASVYLPGGHGTNRICCDFIWQTERIQDYHFPATENSPRRSECKGDITGEILDQNTSRFSTAIDRFS